MSGNHDTQSLSVEKTNAVQPPRKPFKIDVSRGEYCMIRRKRLQKSLEEVANEVGASPAAVSRFENDQNDELPRRKWRKLAQAYGINPEELTFGDEEP